MLNCSSGMTAKVNVLQVETNTVHILRLRQWDWVSLQMCIPPANWVIEPLNRAQQECKQKDEAWRRRRSRRGEEGGTGRQRGKAVSHIVGNMPGLFVFLRRSSVAKGMWVKVHAITSGIFSSQPLGKLHAGAIFKSALRALASRASTAHCIPVAEFEPYPEILWRWRQCALVFIEQARPDASKRW